MGMFNILRNKEDDENPSYDVGAPLEPMAPPMAATKPSSPNFDFDMDQMKQDSDDASEKKMWLGAIGSGLQSMSSAPTFYELYNKTKFDRPDIKGGFDSIAKNIQDPTERQAKLYSAYKNAKEAEQIKNQSGDDAKMRDPDSVYSRLARDKAKAAGFEVEDSMSFNDVSKFHDAKKTSEIKAQSAVDLEKQSAIAKLNHQFAAGENEQKRKASLDEIALRNSLETEKNIPQNVYQAATFGKRVEDANKQMGDLMATGYDPTSIKSALDNKLPERFKSNNSKLMDQSKRNFVNAVLRRESGAAISPTEFESADKQYFPSGGDTPDVLAQKERNRQVAIAGLKTEGSKAWDKIQGNIDSSQSASAGLAKSAPDVEAYAKKHNISVAKAQAIKDGRTGKTAVGGN